MVSLGECTLANDPPGIGDALLEARAQGRSWSEIAKEFDLGNPSAARKAFTKYTGITDYKTKGPAIKLVKPGTPSPGPKKQIAKMIKKEATPGGTFDLPDTPPHPHPTTVKQLNDNTQWKQGKIKELGLDPTKHYSVKEIQDLALQKHADDLGNELFGAPDLPKKKSATGQVFEGTKGTLNNPNFPEPDQVFYKRKFGKSTNEISEELGISKVKVEAYLENWTQYHGQAPGWNGKYMSKSKAESLKFQYDTPNPVTVSELPINTHIPAVDLEDAGEYIWRGPSWGRQWTNSLGHDLTEVERLAIQRYTGSGYGPINEFLRKGYGPDNQKSLRNYINNLDSSMREVPEPVRVKRQQGRSGLPQGDPDTWAGQVVQDKGFISTTVDQNFQWSGEYELIIDVPKGARGRYVENLSSHQHERELILARGTRMVITKVEKSNVISYNSRTRVFVQVLA